LFVPIDVSITRYFDPRTADEFNLRHGLLRKSPLVRNLAFKQQWQQWRRSAGAQADWQAVRVDFESCFFETEGEVWQALMLENRFRYPYPAATGDSKLLFLMDAIKDQLI
jgi:hypothetical protein